jgi:hypothetical protein
MLRFCKLVYSVRHIGQTNFHVIKKEYKTLSTVVYNNDLNNQ